MNPAATALALGAAVLHAGWNLMMKSSGDRLLAAWTIAAVAGLMNVVVLVIVGLPDRSTWLLILLSALVQTVYLLLLGYAYTVGRLSFVYPIARGSAPVLVLILGGPLLSDRIALQPAIGALVVVVALVILGSSSGTDAVTPALLASLATGVTIGTYLLIDTVAVRRQGSALPVVAAEAVLLGVMFSVITLVVRGPRRMMTAARMTPVRSTLGGGASALSYLMVMAATLLAPAGLVASLRETSVVLGVLGGRFMLGEPVDAVRIGAAFLAVIGGAIIALG